MRESRVRKKVEYGRCLLIFLVIQLNGEGQRESRGALEPWRRCQWSTGASQFNDPIMMSQWPNVSQWGNLY